VQSIARTQLLMLGVRHPELYVGRFSRRFDARFTVTLFFLGGSARDLLEAIRSYPLYAGHSHFRVFRRSPSCMADFCRLSGSSGIVPAGKRQIIHFFPLFGGDALGADCIAYQAFQ
jgi:hypothetical protein